MREFHQIGFVFKGGEVGGGGKTFKNIRLINYIQLFIIRKSTYKVHMLQFIQLSSFDGVAFFFS